METTSLAVFSGYRMTHTGEKTCCSTQSSRSNITCKIRYYFTTRHFYFFSYMPLQSSGRDEQCDSNSEPPAAIGAEISVSEVENFTKISGKIAPFPNGHVSPASRSNWETCKRPSFARWNVCCLLIYGETRVYPFKRNKEVLIFQQLNVQYHVDRVAEGWQGGWSWGQSGRCGIIIDRPQ